MDISSKKLDGPTIYFVTGTSGSGKSAISGILSEAYHESIILNVGDLLASFLGLNNEFPKRHRHTIGDVFLSKHDPEKISDLVDLAIIDAYINSNCEHFIIDGIRLSETLNALKKMYQRNIHIHVFASQLKLGTRRIERIKKPCGVQKRVPLTPFDLSADKLGDGADMHVSTTKDTPVIYTNGETIDFSPEHTTALVH